MVYGTNNPLDGEAGVYVWMNASLTDGGVSGLPEDLGIIVYSNVHAGYWRRLFSGPINVQWFAGKVTNNDWAPAFRAAAAAACNSNISPHGAVISVPAGNYGIQSTVNGVGVLISSAFVSVVGDAVGTSQITFGPTGDAAAFVFDSGANTGRLLGCSMRNLCFTGVSGAACKTAVRIVNTDDFLLENIEVNGSWSTQGNAQQSPSIGVEILGGQGLRLRKLYATADRPISIGPAFNTASNLGQSLDVTHIQDLNLGVNEAHGAAIFIDRGLQVTNLVIENGGSSQGKYGLLWNTDRGNLSSVTHSNIVFRDFRVERLHGDPDGLPGAGHSVFVAPYDPSSNTVYGATPPRAVSTNNLVLQNIMCAIGQSGVSGTSDPDGMYFRYVQQLTVLACVFPSPYREALNADGTCGEIELVNCMISGRNSDTQGGAVVTEGLVLVSAAPQPVHPNWDSVSSTSNVPCRRASPSARYMNKAVASTSVGLAAPSTDWDARVQRYSGTLGSYLSTSPSWLFEIPVLYAGNSWNWECAIITVVAHGAPTGNPNSQVATMEGGTFLAVRESSGAPPSGGLQKICGTAGCHDSGASGLVIQFIPGSFSPKVYNYTSSTLSYLISVEFKLY